MGVDQAGEVALEVGCIEGVGWAVKELGGPSDRTQIGVPSLVGGALQSQGLLHRLIQNIEPLLIGRIHGITPERPHIGAPGIMSQTVSIISAAIAASPNKCLKLTNFFATREKFPSALPRWLVKAGV